VDVSAQGAAEFLGPLSCLLSFISAPVYEMFRCLRADISMMIMWNAIDVIGYDGRISELSYALLHIKQDTVV